MPTRKPKDRHEPGRPADRARSRGDYPAPDPDHCRTQPRKPTGRTAPDIRDEPHPKPHPRTLDEEPREPECPEGYPE